MDSKNFRRVVLTVEHVNKLKTRVAELTELREKITADIAALPDSQRVQAFMAAKPVLDDIDREYRITRSEYDILYFTY